MLVNRRACAIEISACAGNQAVAFALGLPANFTMHKASYLFADNAIDYVRACKSGNDIAAPETDDDESSVSSMSSGIYSADDGDVESVSIDEPQAAAAKAVGPALKPAVPRIILSEEEEFGPVLRHCLSIVENTSDSDAAAQYSGYHA